MPAKESVCSAKISQTDQKADPIKKGLGVGSY